jgi:hypothetical protein
MQNDLSCLIYQSSKHLGVNSSALRDAVTTPKTGIYFLATECHRGTAAKGVAVFDTNCAVVNREQQMPKVPSCKTVIFVKQ